MKVIICLLSAAVSLSSFGQNGWSTFDFENEFDNGYDTIYVDTNSNPSNVWQIGIDHYVLMG